MARHPRCTFCWQPAAPLRSTILHADKEWNASDYLCLGCGWSNPEDVCSCCRSQMPTVAEHESRLRAALKEE